MSGDVSLIYKGAKAVWIGHGREKGKYGRVIEMLRIQTRVYVFQNKNNPARDSNPSHWDIGLLVSGLGYKIGYWWLWVCGFG